MIAFMIGVDACNPGEAGVFGGSFWQYEFNTDSGATDTECRVRVNCHAVPHVWQYEALAFKPGLVMRWYRDGFCQAEKEQAEREGRDVYDVMNERAAKVPAGSHALAEAVDLVYVVAVLGIAVDEALAEDLVALAPPVPSECREKVLVGDDLVLKDRLLEHDEGVCEVGRPHALDTRGVVACSTCGDVCAILEGVVHENREERRGRRLPMREVAGVASLDHEPETDTTYLAQDVDDDVARLYRTRRRNRVHR